MRYPSEFLSPLQPLVGVWGLPRAQSAKPANNSPNDVLLRLGQLYAERLQQQSRDAWVLPSPKSIAYTFLPPVLLLLLQ